MTMSLVTISAGAEDFTDADKVTYAEAVDVMTAVGVVGGYADGSFNPTAGLTRGAAAKIICNMILGPTTAEALAADAAPYSDVAVDNVFAGYIAYCAKEGIISGYADGTFRPAAPLTGYAFMKMLLGALGYDADIEGYTGANWSINVAKQALAIGLDDGLVSEFAGTKALTREEACLYAFNTMTADMVNYGNKSSIQVGDITITTSAEASKVGNVKTNYNKDVAAGTAAGQDAYMQFCEQYFTKLSCSGDVDAYGRPVTKWVNNKTTVGKYADEAVLTYTTKVEAQNMADDAEDLGYKVPSTAVATTADNYNKTIALYQNGYKVKDITAAEVESAIATKAEQGGKGIAIELYADANDVIDRAVVTVTYLAKVDTVGKDKVATKAVDERSLTLNDGTVARFEDDTIGFDAVYANVEKGDYVLVIPYADGKTASDVAVEIAIPETVVGSLTYSSTTAVKVAGDKYEIGATATGAPYTLSSKDVTLYLDNYGYAIGCTANSAVTDKAAVVVKTYKTLVEGELTDMVKVITSNGEVADWEYDTVNSDTLTKGSFYTYVEDEDTGVYTLTATFAASYADGATLVKGATTIAATDKTLKLDGTNKAYYADDVKFIFIDNEGKYVVKDGVQKVSTATWVMGTIDQVDGVNYITAVFVSGNAAASSTTSDEIVFVLKTDGSVQVQVDGKDKSFTAYKAYVDGELVDGFYAASTTVDRFYSIEIDDETGAYITSGNSYTATTGDLAQKYTQTVAAVVDNVMTIGEVDYDLSTAMIVDVTTNDNGVDSAALLKDAVANKGIGNVTVSFLYDADDNTVSCLYVTGYTEWLA
jgi:hypothetical protein